MFTDSSCYVFKWSVRSKNRFSYFVGHHETFSRGFTCISVIIGFSKFLVSQTAIWLSTNDAKCLSSLGSTQIPYTAFVSVELAALVQSENTLHYTGKIANIYQKMHFYDACCLFFFSKTPSNSTFRVFFSPHMIHSKI